MAARSADATLRLFVLRVDSAAASKVTAAALWPTQNSDTEPGPNRVGTRPGSPPPRSDTAWPANRCWRGCCYLLR